MKNLKISNKLFVAFGILAVALVVTMVLSIMSQQHLNSAAENLGRSRRDKMVAISLINTATSDYRAYEASIVLMTEPDQIASALRDWKDRAQVIARNEAFLDRSLRSPKSIAQFRLFREHWDMYEQMSRKTVDLGIRNANDQALASFRASKRTFDIANKDAAVMSDIQVALMDKEMNEATQDYIWSRNISIAISVLVLGLTAYLLMTLIRGIANPLAAMTGPCDGWPGRPERPARYRAAPGRSGPTGRGDGGVPRSACRGRTRQGRTDRPDRQQHRLRPRRAGTGRPDQADRRTADRAVRKLKHDFNHAMDSVSATLAAVSTSAQGITNGAADIREASDDLSHRTEQQAASLEETAAAMHEITETVRETAENAKRANQAVTETRTDADQSTEVVRKAVEAMHGIERSSHEISEIIAVIDGIAFQTNLLALNAGVEAARAGDAGKGFAVVASEVRALAQRSADAAKDVKERITASSQQVDTGVQLVAQAGNALTRITGRIGEINALVSDIASAAAQQATGLQQVNTAVAEMDGVTQQNAAMVEQATAAARSLSEETGNMTREVSRFRLVDGGMVARAPAPVVHRSPVHQLQARVAQATPRIAAAPRVARASSAATAVAIDDGDWSEF